MSMAGEGRAALPNEHDPEVPCCTKGSLSPDHDRDNALMEIRAPLMVFATVTASVAYRSGLNPPGGFFSDNSNGHKAGTPILQEECFTRYKIFHYFNTSSFVMSLFILLLTIKASLNNSKVIKTVLHLSVLMDVITLIVAYLAGAHEDLRSSTYAIVLMVMVFIYLVFEVSTLVRRLCLQIWQMAYLIAKK